MIVEDVSSTVSYATTLPRVDVHGVVSLADRAKRNGKYTNLIRILLLTLAFDYLGSRSGNISCGEVQELQPLSIVDAIRQISSEY